MKLAKQFLMIAAIVAITLTYGCKKETPDNNESQPTIAVTYSLLNGAWELVAWDGAPLAEGTYLYVEFDPMFITCLFRANSSFSRYSS